MFNLLQLLIVAQTEGAQRASGIWIFLPCCCIIWGRLNNFISSPHLSNYNFLAANLTISILWINDNSQVYNDSNLNFWPLLGRMDEEGLAWFICIISSVGKWSPILPTSITALKTKAAFPNSPLPAYQNKNQAHLYRCKSISSSYAGELVSQLDEPACMWFSWGTK